MNQTRIISTFTKALIMQQHASQNIALMFLLIWVYSMPRRLATAASFAFLRASSVRIALRLATAAYGLRRCITRTFLSGFFLTTRRIFSFLGARTADCISSDFRSRDRSVLVIFGIGKL